MSWSPRGGRLFRFGADASQAARDIQRELDFHLATRTERLIAEGMEPAAARQHALERFGEISEINADCLAIGIRRTREERRASWWQDLRQDTGYAARSLRRHPGFTLVVTLILALGIGANTATFTLIDALLLRPLPVSHPEGLVVVGNPALVGVTSAGAPSSEIFSYPLFRDLRAAEPGMVRLIATGRVGRLDVIVDTSTRTGTPVVEQAASRFVSEDYFSVLGVQPMLGTGFPDGVGAIPGDAAMVVLAHHWWRTRFLENRGVVGRTIVVNNTAMTIVGVAPPGFTGEAVGDPVDFWVPLSMQSLLMPHRPLLEARNTSWLQVMGRIAPGVSRRQVAARLDPALRRSVEDHRTDDEDATFAARLDSLRVEDGRRGISYERNEIGSALLMLMGAVALVLLVVCANVANLMLARSAARTRELSVRIAIGAGRPRLIRQLFTESLLLSLIGGGLGLVLAVIGTRLLIRSGSSTSGALPFDLSPDWRVLGFAVLVALGTAVICGLWPALRSTRHGIAAALRAQGRGQTGDASRAGRWLVTAQVALSLVLLAGTGMLLRSLRNLERSDLGMRQDELIVAQLDFAQSGYSTERRAAMAQEITQQLRTLPEVAEVTFSINGLFNGSESSTTLGVEGFVARSRSDSSLNYDEVGPGYAATLGARLLRGRDIASGDLSGSAHVVLVNRAFAEHYFAGQDAIGRRLLDDTVAWNVVGVIGDVQGRAVREPASPRVYFPALQRDRLHDRPIFIVRTRQDPARLAVALQAELKNRFPGLAVIAVEPVAQRVRGSLAGDRLMARTLTGFGLLALLLASLGLYGVMAYATLRRTSEFGVRMALGASPREVARLVLREALFLMGRGLLLGIPLALGGAHLLRSQLFGIGPWDPVSLAVAVLALGLSTLLAAWLPARRAARIGPLSALRAE